MKSIWHGIRIICIAIALSIVSLPGSYGQKANADKSKGTKEKAKEQFSSALFSGLKFRSIGPACASGRISDLAINPANPSEYYVAVGSGHVWKTTNAGITWNPVFDNYGAYAIGCLALDPNNPHVVWVGTGENHSQRALGYGDGVYKSEDGGKVFKNMGLKTSRHIGKIIVDPRNSDVVYVASQGCLWGPGGERGVYKTTDGGKTWQAVLTISENTGVHDLAMDPRNPDILYAAAHQRRRHVFTKIDGGPESAIYKTTDGGKSWNKLISGIPSCDKGAIGLAISPENPDIVYAIIQAAGDESGFFCSKNRGASWEKMSSYCSSNPQYYNEIFCDPKDADKIYSTDVFSQVSVDGGKTFHQIGNNRRHVDDHVIWVDPRNTDHMFIGGDGGLYESWDKGANWDFKRNLPVTQFYRVQVDNSLPFYYVYGGTQDNNSMGGPSRNTSSEGVSNDDWFVTSGGDGFWSQIDPADPNIVYAESQYGALVRYDRKSGEQLSIQPQPRKGEYSYRWNWDAPLLISPHSHLRLYFAANKLFRSDDRGNTWKVISDDLTRQIDRNKLEVMGKVWSVDAVAKNVSTSLYGNIVSIDESPVQENLLYVGTDDGLIQVTEDSGNSWRKTESFPGIPETTYVSDVFASRFDANVVYASFNNIKKDDFKPYLLKSTDKGKTWKPISNNLPENGTVHCINQDYTDPDLLFVGTEFGLFVSFNGGENWTQMKAGLPVIQVKDIAIQKREGDLVLATFGRGFYILDDYSCLRDLKDNVINKPANIFKIKDALMYIQSDGKFTEGSNYYLAKNPEFGAVFTYFKRDTILSLKEQRKKKEEILIKENKPVPYPSWDELRAEDTEESPYLLFTIFDGKGRIIRKLTESPNNGINRIVWDLKYQSTRPVKKSEKFDPLAKSPDGILAMPGKYSVSMSQVVNGVVTPLTDPVLFITVVLNNASLPADDRAALVTFQEKVAEYAGKVQGAGDFLQELKERTATLKQAVLRSSINTEEIMKKIKESEKRLYMVDLAMNGDISIQKRNENPPVSIFERLNNVIYTQWGSSSAPTQTSIEQFKIVEDEFPPLLGELKKINSDLITPMEEDLKKINGPRLPGTLPD